MQINRASHVEPDTEWFWWASMGLMDGERLPHRWGRDCGDVIDSEFDMVINPPKPDLTVIQGIGHLRSSSLTYRVFSYSGGWHFSSGVFSMQKNFVRLFAVLQIACVTSLTFAQGDFYAPQVAKTNAESNQNIAFMIVVGGVIAAALIAAAIFFRGRKS